jgi:hypothetical protein
MCSVLTNGICSLEDVKKVREVQLCIFVRVSHKGFLRVMHLKGVHSHLAPVLRYLVEADFEVCIHCHLHEYTYSGI